MEILNNWDKVQKNVLQWKKKVIKICIATKDNKT